MTIIFFLNIPYYNYDTSFFSKIYRTILYIITSAYSYQEVKVKLKLKIVKLCEGFQILMKLDIPNEYLQIQNNLILRVLLICFSLVINYKRIKNIKKKYGENLYSSFKFFSIFWRFNNIFLKVNSQRRKTKRTFYPVFYFLFIFYIF